MKSRIKFFFVMPFVFIFQLALSGQSAAITDPFSDENDVRSNSNEIVITVTNDTLDADIAVHQDSLDIFLAGFSNPGSAITTLLRSLTPSNISMSSENTVATITLPPSSGYYITADENITFTVPAASLQESNSPIAASGTITISNLASTITEDIGDFNTEAPESDIRSGDQTYSLVLENNIWNSTITSSAELLDSVRSIFSGGTYFPDLVTALQSSDISVSGDRHTLTITFRQDAGFYIPSDELINVEVMTALLEYDEPLTNSTESFTILNEDPVLSIVAETYSETDIRTGPISFNIILTGDLWAASPSLANFRSNIQSGGVWDTDIAPNLTISRLDDHTIEVTVPQTPSFDIINSETVEVTALAADIQYTGSGAFLAPQVKTIAPASVRVVGSATFDGVNEDDIRTNTYTITLTLYEDAWDAAIGGNNITNRNLINSLQFLPAESTAATAMRSVILNGNNNGADNTSVSGNVVTFTVPAVTGFNITESVDVRFVVPHEALVNTSSDVNTGYFASINRMLPYVQISPSPDPLYESALNGALIRVSVYEDALESPLSASDFQLVLSPSNPGITIASVDRLQDDSCDIYLDYSGEMSVNHFIDLNILGSGLVSGDPVSGATAPVEVIALIEPKITGISIPDEAMGIGDYVTATITVEEPAIISEFDSITGYIAGRELLNNTLVKLSETTYQADFYIQENTDPQYTADNTIPVSGVRLFNDTIPGNLFDDDIIQGNDLLDSERPVVSLFSFNNGDYNIGDEIVGTLLTPEPGLSFDADQTSINTVSMAGGRISDYAAGNGVYQLTYTVDEGDPDVFSPALVPVNIIMLDAAGNTSVPVISFSGTSPVIDANSPDITAVDEVTSGTVVPGNTIVYEIATGEGGLLLGEGTMVNSVGTGTGRLTLQPFGGTKYRLIYEVGSNDPEVTSGNLTATIILSDPAGNEKEYTGSISNQDVSIVTSSPDARILGGGEICIGDSTAMNISISGGTPPYDVVIYKDGSNYRVFNNTGEDLQFYVSPKSTSEYQVYRVTDDLGVTEYFTRTVEVTVNPIPVVTFSSTIRKIFSVDGGGSYLLPASPAGGIFSGRGVVQDEGRFYPEIAGVADSIPIYYMFQEPMTGCTGNDTVYFDVLPTSGGLTITYPDPGREGIICFNDDQFTVQGNNVDGLIGSFELYRIEKGGDVPVNGAIIDADPNDNMARIDPGLLLEANRRYRVEYHYTWKGETIIAEEELEFDYVSEIDFDKDIPANICKDEAAINLDADPNTDGSFDFSGTGVLGNEILGFTFEPDSGVIGTNIITYTFTSDAGCTRSAPLEIINFDVPDVHFTPQDVCIPPVDPETGEGGGVIAFTNETSKASLVSSWMWEFGDNNSGDDNYDTIPGSGTADNIIHDYTSPGNRNVSLYVSTYQGCDAAYDTTIEFADKPDANFRAVSDCWIPGEPIEFRNKSKSNKSWDSFSWSVTNQSGTWDSTFITFPVDTIVPIYFNNDQSVYSVRMIAKNIAGTNRYCYDTITDSDFELKPTQGFKDGEITQLMDFELSNDKWTADSASDYSSWEWGTPYFEGYQAPDGNKKAWYTRKDKSLPENSWIQSQCFDLRNLERPMIRMDVMRSFDKTRDGAVLQYSLDNGDSWQTLGNLGEGINWYNSFEITNEPGGGKEGAGSPIGWSGSDDFTADSGWVTVAHELDVIGDERLVIFGIYYATDGASVVNNQGFAVDNIYIGERTKHGLIEHFTNSDDGASEIADDIIDNFVTLNNLDVTSLQYHMHYPGTDPMNENNPAPASARSFYYGVNDVPFALLDGGISEANQYMFDGDNPTANQLRKLTLESPLFGMDLSFQLYADHLSGTVSMEALESIDSTDILLNIAVVEKSITGYVGGNDDTEFRNVVLGMVPSAAGTVYSGKWFTGEEESKHFNWSYAHVEDYDELMVVAFLQDRESGKVLQVISSDESLYPMQIRNDHFEVLKIYPNPVRNRLYVEFEAGRSNEVVLEIKDMTGRILQQTLLLANQARAEINTTKLFPGTYLINVLDQGEIIGRSTFIKVR